VKKAGCLLAGVLALVLAIGAIWFLSGWWGTAEIDEDTNFIVPSGASLTSVADKLGDEGLIANPEGFLLRAKLFGSSDPIMAGEFLLPAGASNAQILDTFQHGEVIRRFVTIPEGLPSRCGAGICQGDGRIRRNDHLCVQHPRSDPDHSAGD